MPFIDEEKILDILSKNQNPPKEKIKYILEKAKELKGLKLEDVACLLQNKSIDIKEEMLNTAQKIKFDIYGKRLVLFAPLYISNKCSNNCLYCGFRSGNKELKRRTLSYGEIKNEIEILIKLGHKRILLVCGEHEKESGIDYIAKAVEAIYFVKLPEGEIRRVNVNCAPLSVEEFKQLKAAKIGTYQCFQETYHRETYRKMHPSGMKADYDWRVEVADRAMTAGIDDIGIGTLFGLYDYKFEILAMLEHINHLEEKFGVGPHTISVPRIEPALNAPAAKNPPYQVTDDEFMRLVAILRLAVPYTGMILSTRESAELRDKLFNYGISQISAASRTFPGAYRASLTDVPDEEQFTLGDTRNLKEVIESVVNQGYIPSFCTACYRLGRTGEHFMSLAKPGEIKDFCTFNALLSFMEYLVDFGSENTKTIGEKLIAEFSQSMTEKEQKQLREKLEQIKNGKRDIFV